ncbi:MAG TPA: hypothetical protein EYP87_04115 [Flavobacteriaceae bacterium]|nr:hypothetical protein [Flavobacteriaceae bacterium]
MFNWINKIADYLVNDLFGLDPESHLAQSVHFFIYDTTKILLLLFIIIFFMGIVNSYFPIDRVRNYLSIKKLYGLEYLMASLFGVVTPFCSCFLIGSLVEELVSSQLQAVNVKVENTI